MTQQAFSEARQKFKWEPLEKVFHTSAGDSYNEEWDHWEGFRLLTVDGSFIQLPPDAALLKYYGGLGQGKNAAALVSMLYDMENGIVVDAKIAPIRDNERSLALEHIQRFSGLKHFEKDSHLILFDRGYPSGEFIKSLQDKEIAYVMRTRKRFIREAELKSKQDSWVGIGKTDLRVRAIQIALDNGEIEILISNVGEERIKYETFKELYHKRWGVETKYKSLKQRLELESFSGRLVDNIKQDFYAIMTVANMMALFKREANRAEKEACEESGNQYEYQVYENHAVGVYKDRLLGVVLTKQREERVRLMGELVAEIERQIVPIRPDNEVPGSINAPSGERGF